MKVWKRRRREGKTDYRKRIELLKSEKPRVVFRKSNNYVTAQYVVSKEAQDEVVFAVSSKDLFKYGWPKEVKSMKSIPASYLTGFLIGVKVGEKGSEQPIMDFGMVRVLHKGRVYAFLKGVIDSGININCDAEFFPSDDRIQGRHMRLDFSEKFNQIKDKIGGGKNG